MNEMQTIISEMGIDIRSRILSLKRHSETNKEWGQKLKAIVQYCLSCHLTRLVNRQQVPIYIVDMPYTAETGSGRGGGQNLITAQEFIPGQENKISETVKIGENISDFAQDQTRKIYCLLDIIDGTWNASCGLLFSCSTALAFTAPTKRTPGNLTLADFEYGFIIPYHGDGIYMGQSNYPTMLYSWDNLILQLNMSPVKDPAKTRFILDLFTEEHKDSLQKSIDVIGPVIYDWCDYGRFYGAGVEITALFGHYNITPGFSAFVAASEKMDNIVPAYHMILGAGGIISDWWGNPITTKKLSDRVHVIMSANADLHANLVQHLSKRSAP